MKKWRILFDYDDTLILHDNERELEVIADYLAIECTDNVKNDLINFYHKMSDCFENIMVTRDKFYKYAEESLLWLKKYNITVEHFFRAQEYKDNNYIMLEKDAHEVLQYLKAKGYSLSIFTNGFYEEQVASIKFQGIYDYFDNIFAWDDFYAKPDRRAYIRALDGTLPCENIMIGNSIKNDIIPAKELGIYTFGINLDNKDKINKPDIELNSLRELLMYI